MILTIEELRSYHPASNQVVLKPIVDMSKITHGSLELHTPVFVDKFKYMPVVCSVVSVPRKLLFGTRWVYRESIEELDILPSEKERLERAGKSYKTSETTRIEVPVQGSMPWKTPMELREGDVVWVNSNSLMNAEKELKTIIVDDQTYYLIKYDNIYLKKHEDDVHMLNGWVLAEMIEESAEWTKRAERMGLFIPDIIKKEEFTDRLGVIKYIGEPVEYLFKDRYDHPEIKVNDIVYFKWKVNRKLEQNHKFFAKDVDLTVTRRCNILAIMKP